VSAPCSAVAFDGAWVAGGSGAAAGALAVSLANAVIVVFQPQGRYLLVAVTGPLLALVWAVGRLAPSRGWIGAASAVYVGGCVSLSILGISSALAVAA